MSYSAEIVNLSNHQELSTFFSDYKNFPLEIGEKILGYLNGKELCRMQKTSWTWHFVIQIHFHKKVKIAKLQYIFEKYLEIARNDFDSKELYNSVGYLSEETLSIFAQLKNSEDETPLLHAIAANCNKLTNLLINAIDEENREEYINHRPNRKNLSAWDMAKIDFISGKGKSFAALKPHMRSLTFIGCMITSNSLYS